MSEPPELAIVLPVYNEGEAVEPVLRALSTGVRTPHELVVVYDFDGDTTVPVVARLAAEIPGLRGLRNDLGRGVLNAMKAGIAATSAPFVLISMADGSDEPSVVDPMIALARDGADVVAASRYMRGGRQVGGPPLKRLMSRIAGLTLHWFAGVPTHDPTNNFKLYSRQFLDSVTIESTAGFELALELTVKATIAGRRVAEVPTTWRDRTAGQSNFKLRKWLPHYLHWYWTAFRAIRRRRAAIAGRPAPIWFLLGLLAIAAMIAYRLLWNRVADPLLFFGGDLVAYTSAADRLVTTGTPYHPALFMGPLESGIESVPIGYLYPPVLAQLFVPLREVPQTALAIAWALIQAVCLVILLPLVVAMRFRLTLDRALVAIAFGLSFYPLQFALYGGNVSGWLAIGVALALVAGPGVRGSIAAAATALKFTPSPMFAAALTDRRSRLTSIVTLAAIVAGSVLLAPRAWSDWVSVLPNILRIEMATVTPNFSPANALREIGLAQVGLVIGWALAVGFGVAGLVSGRREGYTRRVMAMAAFAAMFASSTLWDHYLALMAPLILWAWPVVGPRGRQAIAIFLIVAGSLWLQPFSIPGFHLVLLASLVACCLAIATTREPDAHLVDDARTTGVHSPQGEARSSGAGINAFTGIREM